MFLCVERWTAEVLRKLCHGRIHNKILCPDQEHGWKVGTWLLMTLTIL